MNDNNNNNSNNKRYFLRKRDFVIFCISCIAIYLSLDSSSYSYIIEPSWFVDQRRSSSLNNEFKSISPIITDLDGDGENEIVLITKDLHLKVLTASLNSDGFQSIDLNDVYEPLEISSVKLNNLNIQKGKSPVALKTGYIDPYNITTIRKQVIVIVREDWTVSCYDSKLRLLWDKAIAHKSFEIENIINKYKIEEVAILISSIALEEGNNGAIFIGASMGLRHPEESHIKIESGLDMKEDGNEEHKDLHLQASLEHFSVFALDAIDGHVIWKHDGLDVKAEQYIRSLPQHAYTLDVKDLTTKAHHAAGMNHWNIFKQSLIAELPHDWHSRQDNSFRLAHFTRKHIGADADHQNKRNIIFKGKKKISTFEEGGGTISKRQYGNMVSGKGNRFTGVEAPPLTENAVLPHDASEHTSHPNVLVAHTKKGLEVIALMNGEPITSLALSEGNTGVDIDGDGVVDTILVIEKKQDIGKKGEGFAYGEGKQQHCLVMVVSGLPPKAQLFNGTICNTRPDMNDPFPHNNPTTVPNEVSAASPIVLRTTDPKTLLESKIRNIVIAVSTGHVTCYSGKGHQKWHIRGAPIWSIDSQGSAILFDVDAFRAQDLGKHDNVYAQILITGDNSMALLSRNGDILANADIPRKPILKPVIGDFDNDGVTDIIIVTEESILGYKLKIAPAIRLMFIAVVGLLLLIVLVFVTNIRIEGGQIPESTTSNVPRKKIPKTMSILRSTDEYHID